MKWLQNLPIKQKLMLVILTTCIGVLLLACIALAAFELFDFRRAMMRDMTVLADVLGKNTQAALVFQDENAARETMLALQAEPHVVSACLYDQKGSRFAYYLRHGAQSEFPARPAVDGYRFDGGYLALFRPIVLNEKRIGTIFLQADLERIYERLRLFGGITGLVATGMSMLAFALSSLLQRPISGPILALTKTAKVIAEHKDYSLRAQKLADDEVGLLSDSFNEMLDQIQQRDSALQSEVAERRAAEESLRTSDARLRTIVENLEEGVAVSGLNGHLMHFNRAALEMHGFAGLDESLRRLPEFADTFELSNLDGTVLSIDQWPLARILRGESLHDLELRIRHIQAGWQRIFSYGGTLVRDSVDKPVMAIVTIRDITERKHDEEQLRAFNARLEQSNHELQDFAFVASHDLQEPLRKIQTFGDRLKAKYKDALSEQGRDYLERMQNAAKRMQTLITDLLVFSRVTTKAQPFVPVDLNKVVQEVLSDLETQIERTSGRVEAVGLPTIDADPLQMRQLMQNLISNALKFHKNEEAPVVKIYNRFDKDEDANSAIEFCCISVEDNGIGFDEKYLDRIFNLFQRLHNRNDYEGTGIGLAVCRKIVDRHGGSLKATSKLGQGAKFIIALPVRQSKEAAVKL